jgi:hypothetical protein
LVFAGWQRRRIHRSGGASLHVRTVMITAMEGACDGIAAARL